MLEILLLTTACKSAYRQSTTNVEDHEGPAPATRGRRGQLAGWGATPLAAILLLAAAIPPLTAAPVFTASGVVNASGYQTKLAPNSVFVVFGSGLGPSSIATGSAPNYPSALGGTSVTFTAAAGGSAVTAKMVYSLDTQVAGLLPSSIAPGTYAVRVIYNGQTSAPQNVTVAARSLGIATANSAGTGPAQATIGNVNGGISLARFTSGNTSFNGLTWTLTPAHPGDTLVLWGTGGGADPANDTGGTSGDQTAAGAFKVLVNGREVTPLYAGSSSGYPGLFQVNFALPADVTPDCSVPIQVRASGELSNSVSVAVAAAGQTACSSDRFTEAQLALLDAGGTVVGGSFNIAKVTATNSFVINGVRSPATTALAQIVSGGFYRYTAADIARLVPTVQLGDCSIFLRSGVYSRLGPVLPSLDAGKNLPISGAGLPAGASLTYLVPYSYYVTPSTGNLGGGRYTLSGTGGTQIGAFTASVTVPDSFVPTNFDSITSLTRTQPVTLTWTGGGSGLVEVTGNGTSTISGSSNDADTWIVQQTTFSCSVPASRGTLTVPAEVFAYYPPTSTDLTTGNQSYLSITAIVNPEEADLTAPLVGGGQTAFGILGYSLGATKNLPFNQ